MQSKTHWRVEGNALAAATECKKIAISRVFRVGPAGATLPCAVPPGLVVPGKNTRVEAAVNLPDYYFPAFCPPTTIFQIQNTKHNIFIVWPTAQMRKQASEQETKHCLAIYVKWILHLDKVQKDA